MKQFFILLELKRTILKNTLRKLSQKSPFEFALLFVLLLGMGIGLFFLFHFGLDTFQKQKPFGIILMDESFYLFNFGLFAMLLISSGVSASTSLFKSPEVPFLITRRIQWQDIYFVKLLETFWFNSWPLLLMTIPFVSAYGIIRDLDMSFFPFLCILFYLPFYILAVTMGVFLSVLLTWMLPGRNHRRVALGLGVIWIIWSLVKISPQVIEEQNSIAGVLSGYLPHVAFTKQAFLPSAWLTKGLLGFTQILKQGKENLWDQGLFYYLVLLSNSLFFWVPSLLAAEKLYPHVYLRAQDHATNQAPKRTVFKSSPIYWYDYLKWPNRSIMAFLEKDIKTFLRDPSEWSQLIIFFGVLLLYMMNIRNLGLHILKDMLKNIIFVFNTITIYILLSSLSVRFVFPMLSLEGSKAWLIARAPISFASLLIEKFLLGTAVSVLLTMPLVFISGWMLEISVQQVQLTTGLGFFVCIALTGMSVGFGAKFPDFKSNNPSQIISGLGGSLLVICHFIYLVGLGAFLILCKEPVWWMLLLMSMMSLLVASVPLKMGHRALNHLEF